jgi:phage shock protein C
MKKKLYRSRHNRIILGVCGGIAEYFGVSSFIIRLLFLVSGIGIVTYIILGWIIPENPML